MCGGVRGVGAGGIVSSAFCLLYKLSTLKLTRKQINGLLIHAGEEGKNMFGSDESLFKMTSFFFLTLQTVRIFAASGSCTSGLLNHLATFLNGLKTT